MSAYQSNAVWFCWCRDPGMVWGETFITPAAVLDIAASVPPSKMTVQNFFIRVIGEHRAQLLFVFRSVVGRPHGREMSGSRCRVLVRKLGRVRYAKALDLQKSLASSYKTISPSGPVLRWKNQGHYLHYDFTMLVWWALTVGTWSGLHIWTSTERVWERGRETEKIRSWRCQGSFSNC